MRIPSQPPPSRRQSAFTMVEIAICLAIIVFGLVAVIGVLPIGMSVQKDNREETIIGQDAGYFLDAIRRGDRGLDDLTNYVIAITNYVYHFNVDTSVDPWTTNLSPQDPVVYGFTTGSTVVDGVELPHGDSKEVLLTNGARIIGLLSTPRYIYTNPAPSFYSNHVFADIRALSGPVVDKFPQQDPNIRELAFGYRLIPEIVPAPMLETTSVLALTLRTNLHELRLQFRWPLLPNGPGNNRLTYRTMLNASMTSEFYTDATNMRPLYFFNPNNLVFVPPQ